MKDKPVIVISGPPGTGSSTLAKRLAKNMDMDYFSPGKMFKSHSQAPEARAALNVWKTDFGKSEDTHKDLDDAQIEVAKKGNVVICGKLSIHFLKDIADYKIWIDAPLEVRARRSAGRDRSSVEDVMAQIRERENTEREEWRRIYGFDYLEQEHEADFILDNSDISADEAVGKIKEFIKNKGD